MTTNADEERIRSRINKTLATMKRVEHDDIHAHAYVRDVTKLLSLLDRSAAGDGVTVSTLVAYEAGLKNGQELVREACLGKVKERRDRFQAAADASSLPNDLTASRDAAVAAALTRLLGELESLTLDQVEQEK